MEKQKIVISILATGLTVTPTENPQALAQITLVGDYVFDDNVELVIKATNDKSVSPVNDPLNNIVFNLRFQDKVDGKTITTLQGKLYTGGGTEALEANYAKEFGYVMRKLDFYGAMDDTNDFFDVVETKYNPVKVAEIMQALQSANILNKTGQYRTNQAVLAVPATTGDVNLTPEQVQKALIKATPRPTYFIMTDISDLPMIEAVMSVMDKLNNHFFLDMGDMTDWRNVVAFVNGLNLDESRLRILWNPNECRPNNATSVLAPRRWRPCVGDYMAKHLLRNVLKNANGIAPIHVPVGGFDFPLNFVAMRQMAGVELDEEAQNAIAEAGVIVVMSEEYEEGNRWVYGDILTQRDSKTSALRLANASEIETFTTRVVISIIKKHLLSPMSNYINNATSDCVRFLDNCVAAGLLKSSEQLNGQYYALSITPRADKPFEAVDVKFSRRPEGAVRQAFLDTTINK